MGCDYPIICKWYDAKRKAMTGSGCTCPQTMWDTGVNPCEMHQNNIDKKAEQEYIQAVRNGEFDVAKCIEHSPFTNFGK